MCSVDYSIASGNWDGQFRLVHHKDGAGGGGYLHLETLKALDRELRESYTLNITAQLGLETASMIVKVKKVLLRTVRIFTGQRISVLNTSRVFHDPSRQQTQLDFPKYLVTY